MKNKLINFMYGRYATLDEYYKFLLILYICILITNSFLNLRILSIVELFLLTYILYRFLSKDIISRSNENRTYLKIKDKIIHPFNKKEDYVYKKCHRCHKTLKLPLPNERGIKHVVCPKCKKRNTFLILRKLKIEVIKKERKK